MKYVCSYKNLISLCTVSTGIKKKLQKLTKYKECDMVNDWIKSITNHLYWCAASSPEGDGNEMGVLNGTHL